MESTTVSFDLLLELESRHDELLQRLDDLDRRVEKTLIEYQSLRRQPGEDRPMRKVG